MNCANHPTVMAIAYCRACGKPLCATCKREVMGVIYCEQCLAERLKDVHPPTAPSTQGFVAGTPVTVLTTGPSAALAGILSVFPGVGAVYSGQYTKGLVHMGIAVLLLLGIIHISGLVFGLALGFFCLYQMVDAVHSAKAIQMGQAPPDPFGLARAFGANEGVPAWRGGSSAPAVDATGVPTPLPSTAEAHSGRVPTAAVILIGLGVLFLLQTAVFPDFDVKHILPLFLIGLGVWLFVTRSGMLGHTDGYGPRVRPIWDGYDSRAYRRVWTGPIWLITIGGLFLIQSFDGPGFGRTWPVLLLVVGLMKLMGNRTSAIPPAGSPPATGFDTRPAPGPGPVPPSETQSASSEVKNG